MKKTLRTAAPGRSNVNKIGDMDNYDKDFYELLKKEVRTSVT